MGRAWILCKKTFSLSLIFNALLTIACSVGILAGFYWAFPEWRPFHPYVFNGNIFWIAVVAATLNIFPSALIGRKLKTGRFLFHHYVYGFLVIAFAAIYVITFTPVPLSKIFFVNNTSIAVNTGRFFLLGGLTLVLDDLPDVSRRIDSALNWLKTKVLRGQKFVIIAQVVSGIISLYIFSAVTIGMFYYPEWITLANIILVTSLLITSITSFIFVKNKVWHKAAVKHFRLKL